MKTPRILIVLAIVALFILIGCPRMSSAQERPKVSASIEMESGWLKTSYDSNRFVTQRARSLNKILNVEVVPTKRLSLSFRTDIDGKVTKPTFDDIHGAVVKQYDEYEGHDSVMEGLAAFRLSEKFELEIIGGYSRMSFEEDYTNGMAVGLPPVQTVTKRQFSGIAVGLGSWHEWKRASLTARAMAYPHLTKEFESVQHYQGLELRPDIDPEDGWGMDFRIKGDVRLWENISAGVGYQYRQLNSNRLSGISRDTAVKIGEKVSGHYLSLALGVRW